MYHFGSDADCSSYLGQPIKHRPPLSPSKCQRLHHLVAALIRFEFKISTAYARFIFWNSKNPLSEVVIEPLEGVANERKAHLGRLLRCLAIAVLDGLGLEQSRVVSLVNLIGREVSGIDVGCQPGLERSTDAAQAVKVDSTEECVALDFMSTSPSESVLSVADHAIK